MTDEQNAERRRLYDAGLSDRAMAKALNIDRTSVAYWRKRRGLPVKLRDGQATPQSKQQLTPEQLAFRLSLHASGANDMQIARAVGINDTVVQQWRKRHGLPANGPTSRTNTELKHKSLALLARGIGPTLIHHHIPSLPLKTLERWRFDQIAGGSPKRINSKATGSGRSSKGKLWPDLLLDLRSKALLQYANGANDRMIADDLGISVSRVWSWRQRYNLVPNGRRGVTCLAGIRTAKPTKHPLVVAITPLSNPIYAAIATAIGYSLPPDLRDDAISNLFMAVQEGRISITAVKLYAKAASNAVIRDYANPWGNRSLDEQISDSDSFTLMDTLVDERSSSWLEEMGATVW